MDRGTIIDYQIKLFNIPVHWRTLIKEYNSPNSFKDIQLNGPYQKWEHIHTFKECKNGTMMIDEITYSIPFGIIGRLMHFIWVKRELKKIFNYRYKVINEIFEENK